MKKYYWAHENEIDLDATIEWSKPVSFQDLFDGKTDEEEAYFYSIIGKFGNHWKCFYIGKVYDQYVSTRHENRDHLLRRELLNTEYPEVEWQLTLGIPKFNEVGRITRNRVDVVEGLLIYSHWHDEIVNKSKVNNFHSKLSIRIRNNGFIEPFREHVVYGVMTS